MGNVRNIFYGSESRSIDKIIVKEDLLVEHGMGRKNKFIGVYTPITSPVRQPDNPIISTQAKRLLG